MKQLNGVIKKIFFIMLIMLFTCGFKYNVSAAEVRVVSINGGSNDSDATFLHSASLFADIIKNYYVNNIKVENCSCINNPDYNKIDSLIDDVLGKASVDDISIFYYSGHGTLNSDDGKAGLYTGDDRNYTYTHLYDKLKAIKGKKFVILDCCYSGAFITQNNVAVKDFNIITACTHDSYSPFYNKLSILSQLMGKKLMITYFSDEMFKGLGFYESDLKADYDKDSVVTTDELFKYLQKNYQKNYSVQHEGYIVKFNAVPQKYGSAKLEISKGQQQKITLNHTKVLIYKTSTLQLKATVEGESSKVIWTSSNSTVASVDSNGKVTAKKAGIATITARANGKTATCKVTVSNPSIRLNKSKATIYTSGTKTVQLKAIAKGPSNKVIWKTSNSSIAMVSSSGKVIAKKAGTATIKATSNGLTASCKVTVKKVTASIAYKQFMKEKKMYGRYYAILKVGSNKSPILLVSTGHRFDGKDVTSATYTVQLYGYPISLYNYVGGKVVCVGENIPQRMSSGPWYVYRDKLAAYLARGGYRKLQIYSKSYESIGSQILPKDFSKKKAIKLTRIVY